MYEWKVVRIDEKVAEGEKYDLCARVGTPSPPTPAEMGTVAWKRTKSAAGAA